MRRTNGSTRIDPTYTLSATTVLSPSSHHTTIEPMVAIVSLRYSYSHIPLNTSGYMVAIVSTQNKYPLILSNFHRVMVSMVSTGHTYHWADGSYDVDLTKQPFLPVSNQTRRRKIQCLHRFQTILYVVGNNHLEFHNYDGSCESCSPYHSFGTLDL